MFACNYKINGGFKCLTRDTNLNVIKGPARADCYPDSKKNVVLSVSERVSLSLQKPIAFMPNGSFCTGFDSKKEKNELILWEKNGLRHGEIPLPKINDEYPSVLKMKWSIDNQYLAV